MGIEFKPKNTIYINGVPISGVKEINLEPAHPTGDADMYKKQAEELYTAWFKEQSEFIDKLRAEYGTKLIKDDIAVAVAKKPEPKKVYLTTHNPYMSKDWKERFEKIVKERMDKNPYMQYIDTDVASMYPKLEPLVKEELATYSPSKQLYAVGKLAAKGFNKDMRKVHEDAFDAVRYSFDKYCDCAMEKSWEDYCYMIPPRAGKSAALGAIKLGERELEYCKHDVENTMKLYEAFKEKEESMRVVIHRKQGKDARLVSDYFLRKFGMSPYRQSVHIKRGGYAFELADYGIRIDIYCGDLFKLEGLRPDYYSADTQDAVDFLQQMTHKDTFRRIYSLDSIYDIVTHYAETLNERKAKEEKDMNMDLIMNDDVVIRYPDGTEYKARVDVVNCQSGAATNMELHLLDEKPIGKAWNAKPFVTMPRHSGYSEAMGLSQFAKEMLYGVDLNHSIPQIDRVIFNAPATIVYWKDGTKTVVQARDEAFDPEKGLAMAISKKAMGNTRDYYIPFKKWLKKFEKKEKRHVSCVDCAYYHTNPGEAPCVKCNQLAPNKDTYESKFEPRVRVI